MRKGILITAMLALCSVANGQQPVALYQPQTCPNGQCGPVQTVAHGVVNYAGNVGNAIVQPFRGCQGERPQPIRDAIRRLIGGRCR